MIGFHDGVVQHGSQPDGLASIQFARPDAEVLARGSLCTADATAPGGAVQVKTQDARLAKRLLHFHCVQQFAQLAGGRALGTGHQQPCQLLGQRAGTALDATFVLVALKRGREFCQIKTGVLEEALILRRHHGPGEQAVCAQTAFAQACRAGAVCCCERPGAQTLHGKSFHAGSQRVVA